MHECAGWALLAPLLTLIWSPILKNLASRSADKAMGPEARSLTWSGIMVTVWPSEDTLGGGAGGRGD